MLSQNPGVKDRLVSEIRDILGDRIPGPADLSRLRFAEAVALESLRLYPPVYAFGREAAKDYEVGGYRIPRGALVFFQPMGDAS